MKIGLIGAAEMGTILAKKFVALGHDVSVSNSRGADTLKSFQNSTGAKAVSVEEIVAGKDVIIIAIPLKNIPLLSPGIFKEITEDTVVIETCNYYPTLRDGDIPALRQSGIDSLWVQEVLGVTITKIFNSILATSIENKSKARGDVDRVAISVAGDSVASKDIAAELADELGFDVFDVGGIASSWKQQPGTSIYCRDLGLAELKRRIAAMSDDWSVMRKVILPTRSAHEKLMREDYGEYLRMLGR